MNLKISIGGNLIMDRNPKGCKLAEHTSTKVEINIRMISKLKKQFKHEPTVKA